MIITHKFKKLTKKIINKLTHKEIKSLIDRKRLKFTHEMIQFYIFCLYKHSLTQKTLKSIYKKSKQKGYIQTYQNFMKNIALFSKVFKYLFHTMNKLLFIKPSQLLNIVDSTLIPEKQSCYITQKDWNLNKVTTRTKDTIKIRTCGSKGLVFINRFNQIYYAELLNINISDMNILKESARYKPYLQGILLADRGFSNKLVRSRLNHDKNNIFDYHKVNCRLISPYRKSENKNLTEKEIKLYKYRWRIETLFQTLKSNYSDNLLNLKGKYQPIIKQSKFYTTLMIHNLSTL